MSPDWGFLWEALCGTIGVLWKAFLGYGAGRYYSLWYVKRIRRKYRLRREERRRVNRLWQEEYDRWQAVRALGGSPLPPRPPYD